MRAIWNGVVIADSHDTVVVEGNHYFPLESVRAGSLESSTLRTTCSWKGVANYYDVVAAGERNLNAAWYYVDPYVEAEIVRGRVAFWNGVEIVA